jgi:6-phosphogluconolactonase (cycloisomerase 2 family)
MPGRWDLPKKVANHGSVSIGQHPMAVSINPNGRDVFVLDADKQIHQLQLDSRDGSLKVNGPAVSLKAEPAALVIDPAGHFAYLRYASRPGITRFEIDPVQGRLRHPTDILGGITPSGLAFSTTLR